MRTEYEVKINIYRHGMTPMNERHCYIGSTDESLSESGASRITSLKESGYYNDADYVFISPMKRAKETAEIAFSNADFVTIPEFSEMDFGSFEGKCYEELKDNPYYRKWIDDSVKNKSETTSDNKKYDEDNSHYETETSIITEIESDLAIKETDFVSKVQDKIILPENKADFILRVSEGMKKVLKTVTRIYEDNSLKEQKNNIKRLSDKSEEIINSENSKENARKNDVTDYRDNKSKNVIDIKFVIVAHGGTIMALTEGFTDNDYYSSMVSCGEGISVTVKYYMEDNSNVTVSSFSINNRICP